MSGTTKNFTSFKEVLKNVLNIGVKESVVGFSIWLAIFSLFISVNADIFEQEQEREDAIIFEPLRRLLRPSPPSVGLSALLAPKQQGLEGEGARPTASYPNQTPLYIFAIDVSKSMLVASVSEEELKQYFKDINGTQTGGGQSGKKFAFLTEDSKLAKSFEIARAELHRYVETVPDKSQVALYTFGKMPQKVQPPEPDAKYITIEKGSDGKDSRKEVTDSIPSLVADQDHTNFEELLRELKSFYKDDFQKRSEIHIIIISDFTHDIDGGQYEKLTESGRSDPKTSFWESRYRISSTNIASLFRDLERSGNTFHLAKVSGGRREICAILPIVGESLEMYSYRETKLLPDRVGKEFDFLRSYEPSQTPITFFYTPGNSKTMETEIVIDDEKYQDSSLRFALASEVHISETYPLKLDVRFHKNGGKQGKTGGILRLDRGGQMGEVQREGDSIILQSLCTLEPREAAAYRLLISWNNPSGVSTDGSNSRTFAIPIVFRKRLSFFSALSILVSILFVLFFAIAGVRELFKIVMKKPDVAGESTEPESAKGLAAGGD